MHRAQYCMFPACTTCRMRRLPNGAARSVIKVPALYKFTPTLNPLYWSISVVLQWTPHTFWRCVMCVWELTLNSNLNFSHQHHCVCLCSFFRRSCTHLMQVPIQEHKRTSLSLAAVGSRHAGTAGWSTCWRLQCFHQTWFFLCIPNLYTGYGRVPTPLRRVGTIEFRNDVSDFTYTRLWI